MLSEEVIDRVVERLVNRIEQGNEYVLKRIGESVKTIGTLSPNEAEELKVMIYGPKNILLVNIPIQVHVYYTLNQLLKKI